MKLYDDQLIIVTGGAGFIGSCFVRYLNEKGLDNIVIVDELGTTDKWKNLVGKQFFDVVEKHQLFDWLQGRDSDIEAVVHLGACSSTVEKDASYLLQNNYRYSIKLAEWALRFEKRFLYASSAATYGDGSLGFDDDVSKFHTLRPLNMYGYSKQLFDMWLINSGVLKDVVGVKFFNIFGPNEYHKERMASAVYHMVPQVQKTGKVKLFRSSEPGKFGDGEQCRDFLYVKDAVKMTYDLLAGDAGGIYNIGSGKASTWNQLAEGIFKALDLPVNIEYIKMPDDLVGKYQNYTCANMKKTDSVITGTKEVTPLEDTVGDYVKNHLIPGKTW